MTREEELAQLNENANRLFQLIEWANGDKERVYKVMMENGWTSPFQLIEIDMEFFKSKLLQ